MNKNTKGFTLIELLVVIAIIGVLAAIILISLGRSTDSAKYARAQSDLKAIHDAVEVMYNDTGEYPNHFAGSPCVDTTVGNEIPLSDCASGIQCEDGSFTAWAGPYIGVVPLDPWGNDYHIDYDFECYTGVPGCQDVPDGAVVRALVSFGPNGNGINNFNDTDDQVLVMCQ